MFVSMGENHMHKEECWKSEAEAAELTYRKALEAAIAASTVKLLLTRTPNIP